MNIDPDKFWVYTPYEFSLVIMGRRKAENEEWRRTRRLGYIFAAVQGSKINKEQELFELDGDAEANKAHIDGLKEANKRFLEQLRKEKIAKSGSV